MLQGMASPFLSFFFERKTFNVFVCLPAACLHGGSSVTSLVDVSALRSCQEALRFAAVLGWVLWVAYNVPGGGFCPGLSGTVVYTADGRFEFSRLREARLAGNFL